jgi:hypothetical protein
MNPSPPRTVLLFFSYYPRLKNFLKNILTSRGAGLILSSTVGQIGQQLRRQAMAPGHLYCLNKAQKSAILLLIGDKVFGSEDFSVCIQLITARQAAFREPVLISDKSADLTYGG